MSLNVPLSAYNFAVAGWNFFNQILPNPTSAPRMLATGLIVSAVALVLLAKISLLAGLTLTLGAYNLVNHSDLKAFAHAQKELEEKLQKFNTCTHDLNKTIQTIKDGFEISRLQKVEVVEHSLNLASVVPQIQNYLANVDTSADFLKKASEVFDSKLNQQETNLKRLEENILDNHFKITALQENFTLFQENTKYFYENIENFKKELLALETIKLKLEEAYFKIQNLQDEGRGNVENMNLTIRETASRLETVASSLEKISPLLGQIPAMEKRIGECWDISQRLRQEQQAPRVAPMQQFQQVVRTVSGNPYRR